MDQRADRLTVHRIAEIIEAACIDGLHYSQNGYDTARYQRILGLARLLGEVPAGAPALSPRGPVTPKVAVEAAVYDPDGRILMIRRKDSGLWAMPGGAVELGETPSQAVLREVFEETAIQAKPLAIVGVFDNWNERKNLSAHIFHVLFAARCEGLQVPVAQPEEILEASFIDTATALRLPLHAGHQSRLQAALTGTMGLFD